jgi:outer membrane protein
MKSKIDRLFLAAILTVGLGSRLPGQVAADQKPRITSPRNPYGVTSVSAVDFRNSGRIRSLLRDGRLYLSLADAIALALENNLDIELQRLTPGVAETDLLRAQGGGLLRGVPLSLRQLPAGVGGPASPLVTTLGGSAPLTQLPGTLTDLAAITEQETNLSVQGPTPLSNGPPVPHFDPSLVSQFNWGHQETPQLSPQSYGTNNFINNGVLGSFGIQRGFSTGATLNLGYSSLRQNSNSTQANLSPYTLGSLGLTVVQPFLQGFGLSVNRRFIRIARNNQHISDSVFREQLISTASDVIRLYWDLVSLSEDVKVKQTAVSLAQKLYEDNKAQVETGTLPPLELKRAQAELSRTQEDLTNAQSLLLEQELILKNVLTRDAAADPELARASITPLDQIQVPRRDDLPTDADLIAQAMQNRPDLEGAHLQIANSEISLRGSKNALLPEVDLVGSYQSNSLSGQINRLQSAGVPNADPSLLGGFGTNLSQLFNGRYPNYSVGLQLSIPLGNRVARADLARDQVQLRQTEVRLHQLENQIKLEVQMALVALQRARTAYAAAVQTRQLQEEALAAEQERYAVGAATSFFVIQYERDLTQARSTEVATAGAYAKARAALDRAIGATLQNNHISVDDAYRGEVAHPPSALPAPEKGTRSSE